MSKEIELHEHAREDIRIDLLCEDVIDLTEHLRLKEEECKQLQQDNAELVEALGYVTERFESHLTDKYYITKDSLYGDGFACQSLVDANELLEKHK